jgi:hypothetical protein
MHVREAAAYGLAALGDVLALDTFVTWLDAEVPFFAKVGARAIGQLGDVRGAGALLRALGDGVSPGIVGDALALLGPWVLGPLLDLTEAKPEVGKRASVGTLVSTFPADHAAATIAAWLAAAEADPVKLAARARLAFDVTSKRPDVARGVAEWCRERGAFAGDDKEAKALRKKIDAVLAPPKPKGAKGAK